MPEGFGARLRKHREERQIDLSWIAEQTKIKRSLLEAFERDDVSRWPSGIFRRAYVRTYAHSIGLDPDVVLREFLEVHPEPVDVVEAAAAAAREEADRRHAASGTRLRTIVDSAIGSLARLRRPGAVDGPMPPGPPLTAPARAVVAPPVAPHDSAAPLEYAPELDAAPETEAAAELAETSQEDAAQEDAVEREELLHTRVEHEASPSTATPEISQLPLALMLEADDDGREQATAAVHDRDIDAPAEAPSAERRATIDSRLETVATLCTEFGRARGRDEILMLLEDSARALDATGLIVWLWDESVDALRPTLVHGYSDQVLAHLPTVRRDADNATAEAFRSARPCEVAPSAHATGALVVPLLIPEGCAGVLAVELQPGIQAPGSVRALATVLAAALAQFVHRSRSIPSGRRRTALPS